jgi:hypothetical protein
LWRVLCGILCQFWRSCDCHNWASTSISMTHLAIGDKKSGSTLFAKSPAFACCLYNKLISFLANTAIVVNSDWHYALTQLYHWNCTWFKTLETNRHCTLLVIYRSNLKICQLQRHKLSSNRCWILVGTVDLQCPILSIFLAFFFRCINAHTWKWQIFWLPHGDTNILLKIGFKKTTYT